MELSEVLSLISQYGFPIVMCCVVCYLLYKETNSHKEEAEKWQKCIDNNTSVMEKVLDKLS